MKNKLLKGLKSTVALGMALVLLISPVLADAAENRIEILASSSDVFEFEEEGGALSKNIVASNLKTGELTIEVKISNAKLTEVFFVVDNSTEWGAVSDLKTNVISASKTLTESLHDNLKNLKTGLLMVHPNGTTVTAADNGGLLSALSETKDNTLSAFDTLSSTAVSAGQDFVEVLTKAQDSFSADAENKIIFLVLNDIEETNIATYKAALTNLATDIKVVTFVVGNTDANITQMFGTVASPTRGVLFLDSAANIDTVIGTNFRDEVLNTLPKVKNSLLLEDFFTAKIVKNFDIEYLGEPSHGTVGAFNGDQNKFSWTIGTLARNDIATFQYKLILHDKVTADSIDTLLDTNEEVRVLFVGSDGTTHDTLYECSPIIRLPDNVVNPKTGISSYLLPSIIILCVSVFTISYVKRKDAYRQF